ncbi:MAG TPA: PhzF family phenazine biosynthesis protein [Jatrophihabitans sp.]|nr:PhzF family phenazine biosynthesis protein [Jatrophihabitans sp.]
MTLRLRTVDAFTDRPFTGNPAGVIRLDDRAELPPESWYRAVAGELNLSETAFLERWDGADYRLPAAIGHQPEYLGVTPSGYLLAVIDGDSEVRRLRPDLATIKQQVGHGVIVSAVAAESSGADIVSRFFAPALAVPEDPVTGAAHTVLLPYWSQRLGRTELTAAQVSPRGGRLALRLVGDRVLITGRAVTVLDARLLSVPSGRLAS